MNFVTLVEIDFSSGTRYFSFQGDRTPSQWYKPKLISLGRVSYSLDPLTGSLRIGDLDIVVNNADVEFSLLRAQDGFYNVPVRVLCGDLAAGEGQLTRVFDGRIYRWSLPTGVAEFRAEDYKFGRFQERVTQTLDVISEADYPNLPANVLRGELIPLVYGSLASTVDLPRGQVACTLVDPAIGQTKFRYLVCQHLVDSITQVYRYGIAVALPTVTVISGRTYLDFDSDQRAFRDYFDKTYDAVVVAGAVSRWLFNEGAGATVNDEDDSNDAALTGGAAWHTASYGKKFVNLETGYLNCGRPANLELTGDMTIIIWTDIYFGVGNDGNRRVMVNNGEQLNVRGWSWYWDETHSLAFRTNTSGANQVTKSALAFSYAAGDTPGKGQFVFLALRKSAGVVTMYYGDQELSEAFSGYDSQPTHTAPATPTNNFLIGDSADATTMRASVAHLRIFNSALTDAQIKALARIPFANFIREDENEITADVDGIMGGSPEVLLTNPVLQARDWLLKAGVDQADIDEASFTAAAARSDALGYQSAFAVLDRDAKFEDVLSQLASAFGIVIALTASGKYGAYLFHSVQQSDIDSATQLSDSNEIVMGSFEQRGSDYPVSSIRYNHSFQWVEQVFEVRQLHTDAGEVSALGQDILHDSDLDLWPIRNQSLALGAAERRISLLREDRIRANCGLPIQLFARTICEFLAITHREGADVSGFIDKLFRIIEIQLDLDQTRPRVLIEAIQAELSSPS